MLHSFVDPEDHESIQAMRKWLQKMQEIFLLEVSFPKTKCRRSVCASTPNFVLNFTLILFLKFLIFKLRNLKHWHLRLPEHPLVVTLWLGAVDPLRAGGFWHSSSWAGKLSSKTANLNNLSSFSLIFISNNNSLWNMLIMAHLAFLERKVFCYK